MPSAATPPTLRPLPRAPFVLAAALALAPASGRAAPQVELRWQAPAESCPQEREVSERLLKHLGPGDASLEASVFVAQVGATFRAQIVAPGAIRDLEGESCSALADAVVAVVSLLARPAPGTPAAEGQPAAPRPPAPADAPPSAPLYVHLGAGLLGDTAALPAPALGLGAQGGLRWGRLRAELGAAFWPRRERELGGEPPAGGRVGLTSFMAQICASPYDRALRLEGCAGGEVGVISAEGFGAEGASEKRRAWYAAQAGLGAAWSPGPHLMLRAQGGALVPLTHPRFLIEGAGEVHRPPALGARLFLGVDTFF